MRKVLCGWGVASSVVVSAPVMACGNSMLDDAPYLGEWRMLAVGCFLVGVALVMLAWRWG